jgi:hypothetical protein
MVYKVARTLTIDEAAYLAGLIDGKAPSRCRGGMRRLRAKLALDQYLALTPRNGKYTDEVAMRRAVFESTFLNTTACTRSPRGAA